MKLGAHTMLWLDCLGDADLSLLDRISAFGYDAVEVVVGERPLCPRALADRLGRLGLSASVSCAIPPERAPGSPDPASRHAALRFFRRCFETAAAVGASNFVGPLYLSGLPVRPRTQAERQTEWRSAADTLREAARIASDYGVTLCIEPLNRYKTDLINTVRQGILMVDEIGLPNVKLLYDTYHANIEERSLTGAIGRMGTRYLGEIHLCENDKGAPGTGHIDFPAVAAALRQIGFDGFAVFESFPPFGKDNIWRQLASDQDSLAQAAARYLRALFCPPKTELAEGKGTVKRAFV